MVLCSQCLFAGQSQNALGHNSKNIRCPNQPWNIMFWDETTHDGISTHMPTRSQALIFRDRYIAHTDSTTHSAQPPPPPPPSPPPPPPPPQHLFDDLLPSIEHSGADQATPMLDPTLIQDLVVDPSGPTSAPAGAIAALGAVATVDPSGPVATVDPSGPVATVDPSGPVATVDPSGPVATVDPSGPVATVDPTAQTYAYLSGANTHNSNGMLEQTISDIDNEVHDILNKSTANFKLIINKYITILKIQQDKIDKKDHELKKIRKNNIQSLAKIDYLDSLCNQFEDTIYQQTYTIEELQKQLAPRDDDKGKSLEKIMEVVEDNMKIMGSGAYKNIMDIIGQEYNT